MPTIIGRRIHFDSDREFLHPTLEDDLQGHLQADISVEHFVEHIWGLNNEHAAAILDTKWTLDPIALQEYQKASTSTRSKNTENLYPPFVSIATKLLSATRATINHDGHDSANPIEFIEVAGGSIMKTASGNRAPDGFTMWDGGTAYSGPVQAIIEFKRKNTTLPVGDSQDSSKQISNSHSDENHIEQASPHLEKVLAGTGVVAHVPSCETTKLSSQTSKKRKYSGSAAPIAKKRPRTVNLTPDQLQLASYALDRMSEAPRVYVTGILIDNFRISLWYFDRIGVISSVEFGFDQSPEKLALVVFALGNCDPIRAGFDPFVVYSSEAVPSSAVDGIERPPIKMEDPFGTSQGAQLVIPNPSSGAGCGSKQISYTITDVRLYKCYGLVGRGTTVYPVAELDNDQAHSDTLVAKLSWPSVKRTTREDTFIAQIRKDVPYMQAHLPEVKFSATFTPEDLNLPRTRIPSFATEPAVEERVLTVLVTSRYQKLLEVKNVEEFQSIFIDFVECHHHVYEHAKVLHCDLSENNLMFLRSEGGGIRGILNDWDLASNVDDKGDVHDPTPNRVTGTLPFMAFDLLDRNPPPHFYRHDLESFFYILVWVAVHYDFPSHRRRQTNPLMESWESDSHQRNSDSKAQFIFCARTRDDIVAYIQDDNWALYLWIDELWHLFRDAMNSVPDCPNEDYDLRTCGGRLTFHTFMAAIRKYSNTLST